MWTSTHKIKIRVNFFKADYDLVRNRLNEKNLESAVRGLEVNDAWKKFNGIMREIIEKNMQNHQRTNKRRPWVTYFRSVFTLDDSGNIPEPKQTCL